MCNFTNQLKSNPEFDCTAYSSFDFSASFDVYGGSLSKFIHVAAVGNRVKSAVLSAASDPAVPLL